MFFEEPAMKFSAKITAPLLASLIHDRLCRRTRCCYRQHSYTCCRIHAQLTDLTAITTWSGFAMGQNAVYNTSQT